jgi:hypothetical protein
MNPDKKNILAFLPFFFSVEHYCNIINAPEERKTALAVYKKLMDLTANKFIDFPFYKSVFLSDYQEEYQAYASPEFDKFVKVSNNLSANYQEVFSVMQANSQGGSIVLISGTCLSVEPEEIYRALDLLMMHDVVFSYAENTAAFRYLAVKTFHPDLFKKQTFSSRESLLNWLYHLKDLNINYLEVDSGFDPGKPDNSDKFF